MLGLGLSLPAWSADAQLQVSTLPSASKRPYVAVWVEKATSHVELPAMSRSGTTSAHIATKWLPDLRSWWKVSGSQASLPIDGRIRRNAPGGGEHTINLGSSAAFKKLARVITKSWLKYHASVADTTVRLPLQWPPRAPQQTEAKGTQEVGQLKLTLKP